MKKSVAIIGGGAAGLAAASLLDPAQFEVTIYEKNKTIGRKFLVAGIGGFNLTHAEPIEKLIEKYSSHQFLKPALLHFNNLSVQEWFSKMGVPTFIGSSQRVFPEASFKPIQVLDAMLEDLKSKAVKIQTEKEWTAWNENQDICFSDKTKVRADYVLFCLGGASWKVTGSDGQWASLFQQKDIETTDFEGSNCRFLVDWPEEFISHYEGRPLKNIAIASGKQYQKGEAILSKNGIEGNAIYALSPAIREGLKENEEVVVYLDLKPAFSKVQILSKMTQKENAKTTDLLRNEIKLSKEQIALLKALTSKDEFSDTKTIIKKIKKLPLKIKDLAPIDQAISTVGGLSLSAVNQNFEILKLPNHYAIGEMLDWDAPTGGYLLQACFSMGAWVAKGLNEKSLMIDA